MEASAFAPYADFGPLVTSVDVDEQVLATLRMWLPTHLSQLERERGMTLRTLDRPKDVSYANALDEDEFPDHTLPAVITTTAQTEGQPEKDGDGNYYAAWNVVVSAIVKGRHPVETRRVAALFEGAVRRVLVQHGIELDGEVAWRGSNVAAVADPTNAGRFLAAGMSHYVVFLDRVVQDGVGPLEPDPDDPYDPLVRVASVSVDIEGRSAQEELGG